MKPQAGSTFRKATAPKGKTGIGSQPIIGEQRNPSLDSTAFVSLSGEQVTLLQALLEAAAVVGTGGACDSLSHRGRPSASTRLVPGCGSAAPDPAEPRSRGSAAGHGRRSERTEVWGSLRGTISATKLALCAGGAMKTKKTGEARGQPRWSLLFLGGPSWREIFGRKPGPGEKPR